MFEKVALNFQEIYHEDPYGAKKSGRERVTESFFLHKTTLKINEKQTNIQIERSLF